MQIPLEVAGAGALLVETSSHEITLFLRDAGGRVSQLGWNDQAHWHPNALRWQEIDVISRACSRVSVELEHPGLALLLLWPFSALGDDEPVEDAFASVLAAWRSLDLPEADAPLDGADFRGQHVRWVCDARGRWYPLQEETRETRMALYSLRHPDNEQFPFDELDSLVNAARRAVDQQG
jgi:hypothetical protein